MAGNFNLSDFKTNEYLRTLYDPTKLYTAAENNMEQQDIERAQEAVNKPSFLSLTLSEKLAELGIGKRVVQQLGETAAGMVTGVFEPIVDYIDKYQNIFDQKAYNAEIQSYAKQMFFAGQAMEVEESMKNFGRKFMLFM